jgi:hypothetical protein
MRRRDEIPSPSRLLRDVYIAVLKFSLHYISVHLIYLIFAN